MLSAIKKYDLIKEENKRIFVTEKAKVILVSPDKDKRKEVIRECALSPVIFKKLWNRYYVWNAFYGSN